MEKQVLKKIINSLNLSRDYKDKFFNFFYKGVKDDGCDSLNKMIEVTYQQLVDLRNTASLIPGQSYRITDYECTTVQEDTKSAGHQFDIIVVADDEKTLNENARAIQHKFEKNLIPRIINGNPYRETVNYGSKKGHIYVKKFMGNTIKYILLDKDTFEAAETFNASKCILARYRELIIEDGTHTDIVEIISYSENDMFEPNILTEANYFNNCNLAVWELKYSLDNDNAKFAWADTINGKGVIYYMKDEWLNECPYDFKNIQFKRFKVLTVTDAILNGYIGKYIGLANGFGYTVDTNEFKWFYTFSNWADENTITDASRFGIKCGSNIIGKYRSANALQQLNNNTIVHGDYIISIIPSEWTYMKGDTDIYNNFLGDMTYNNALFGYFNTNNTNRGFFRNITLFGGMRHNVYSTDFQESSIYGQEFCWNTFNDYFANNIIGTDYHNNTLSASTHDNSFGNSFYRNSVSGQPFYENIIGNNVRENIFHSVYKNTIGNDCRLSHFMLVYSNTIGTGFLTNQCISVYNNTFGNSIICCVLNNFYNGSIGDSSRDISNFGQTAYCFIGKFNMCVEINNLSGYLRTADGTSTNRWGRVVINSVRGNTDSIINIDSPKFVTESLRVGRSITIEGTDDGKIVATWKHGLDTIGIYKDSATDSTWKDIPTV